MSDEASIVAELRLAVKLLSEVDKPAVTAAAAVIDRCLAGADFDAAAGLTPGWRRRDREQSRDRALNALVKLHPTMNDSALVKRIIAGVAGAARIHGTRPDGESGYFWDLLKAEAVLGCKQWGRLLEQIRGHCKTCDVQRGTTGSAPRRTNAKATDHD